MDDFALTPAERVLFDALNRRGVPFIIIGMGAAVLPKDGEIGGRFQRVFQRR